MTQPAAGEVWRAVLGELQLQLPRSIFETWLKQTEAVGCDGNALVVEAPTPFAVEWLELRMYQSIRATVEKVAQQPLDVHFRVKHGINQQPGQAFSLDPEPAASSGEELSLAAHGRRLQSSNLNPKYTFESFVVGPSNHLAYNAALAVADAPGRGYNPLFLYSGVGLGKTHLLHAIGHICVSRGFSVLYATSEQFTNEFISAIRYHTTEEFRHRYRSVQVLLMDDVQFMSGKEQTHEGFFHTFNDLHNSGNQVVVTSDRPPRSLALLEDRMRSRFEWGLTADIQPPNLETRMAILAMKAEQLGIQLDGNVAELIAKRVQKNVRELEGCLNRIAALAGTTGGPITLEATSKVLDDLLSDAARHDIDPQRIIEEAARHYRLSARDILGRRRTQRIALARQVTMYLLIYELELSPTQVGRLLGGRDHATVIYGAGKINGEVNEDGQLRQDVLAIKEAIFKVEAGETARAQAGG